MSDRVFVDTNILVYAHDVDAGRKHDVARALVEERWASRDGILSTQVLQEFYVGITRKIPKPLSRRLAREMVRSYSAWEIEPIGVSHVLRASRIEERYRLSFWDALIIAAAKAAKASRLLSEDLQGGQRVDGVAIENPFRA